MQSCNSNNNGTTSDEGSMLDDSRQRAKMEATVTTSTTIRQGYVNKEKDEHSTWSGSVTYHSCRDMLKRNKE